MKVFKQQNKFISRKNVRYLFIKQQLSVHTIQHTSYMT